MRHPQFFGKLKDFDFPSGTWKGQHPENIIFAVAESGPDGPVVLGLYTKPNSPRLYYQVEKKAKAGELAVPEHKVLHWLDTQAKRFKDPDFLAFLQAFRAEYKQLLAIAAYGGNLEKEALK